MTEARDMLSDELVEAMENLHLYPRLIAERAAKEAVERAYGSRSDARLQRDVDMVNAAVAAERARIAEAVRGLYPYDDHGTLLRILFGGETEVRAAAWVGMIEAEARRAALTSLRERVAGMVTGVDSMAWGAQEVWVDGESHLLAKAVLAEIDRALDA
jgi:hypothetical protein